jgi:hypothetical protein
MNAVSTLSKHVVYFRDTLPLAAYSWLVDLVDRSASLQRSRQTMLALDNYQVQLLLQVTANRLLAFIVTHNILAKGYWKSGFSNVHTVQRGARVSPKKQSRSIPRRDCEVLTRQALSHRVTPRVLVSLQVSLSTRVEITPCRSVS